MPIFRRWRLMLQFLSVISTPVEEDLPARRKLEQVEAAQNVDLPLPEGLITTTTSPLNLRRHAVQRADFSRLDSAFRP